MSKRFWLALIIATGFMIGAFVLSGGKAEAPKSDKFNDGDILSIKDTDYKQGAGNKNVTIIEYADFQCPACGALHPILKEVKDYYQDDITFVFRNFPLIQIHQNAQAAHRAAEASGRQNKFWEMHDLLYENQQIWSESDKSQTIFEGFAQQLGLDIEKYKTDFASEDVNTRISADMESGKKLSINGTPTIFINGQQVKELPRDIESFKKLIDEEIAKSNQSTNQ